MILDTGHKGTVCVHACLWVVVEVGGGGSGRGGGRTALFVVMLHISILGFDYIPVILTVLILANEEVNKYSIKPETPQCVCVYAYVCVTVCVHV